MAWYTFPMEKPVCIIGAGLAGSEAALQLAARGIDVRLHEMRPVKETAVHKTALCAELVCSNSLKSMKATTAAGMLKEELKALQSFVFRCAEGNAVPAGGALAVNREQFAQAVTRLIEESEHIELVREEVASIEGIVADSRAVVLATGPLTSDALALNIEKLTGNDHLAFFDAAAPIVMADSLDYAKLFRQSRYEDASGDSGDYLNAPMNREEYGQFIEALLDARRVILKDFESRDLFQACQPIEEIARAGRDAPRFGPLKPVGLTDPRTGKRPWAAVQLRAENGEGTCYNLVGFQTNLAFDEQKRVFSLIPGLEHAEFARFGVMHRNTFIDAPRLLDEGLALVSEGAKELGVPIHVAGQLGGTEGYCEAIRSGIHVALAVAAESKQCTVPPVPRETVFGALLAYATNPDTNPYQPMHVNFGILPPLDPPVRNKSLRYEAYAKRGAEALSAYCAALEAVGLSLKGDA